MLRVAVRWATVLVLSVICLEIFLEINVVVCPWALALTFVFLQWCLSEAASCPTKRNVERR